MKTCILVPAYNCSDTIAEVCRRIPLTGPEDEILVVDDGSGDGTLEIARCLSRVHAVRNDVNLGYGGTSNRLYALARERGADVTVNVHGDLGHRPEEIPLILDEMRRTEADVVVGTRLLFLKNVASRKAIPGSSWTKAFAVGCPVSASSATSSSRSSRTSSTVRSSIPFTRECVPAAGVRSIGRPPVSCPHDTHTTWSFSSRPTGRGSHSRGTRPAVL